MLENNMGCLRLKTGWPSAAGNICGLESISKQNSPSEKSAEVDAAIVWKGGGADARWSNPLNWCGERVPRQCDRVVFDGTSAKDAALDCEAIVKSLEISSEYGGTLASWPSASLTANETISIRGGTVNARLRALGNLAIAGGTVNGSLEAGGNLAIANGSIHCYISARGDLIIKNGTIVWYGGKVQGDALLSGGALFLAGSYYFEGDFKRTGGTLSGTPSFYFTGTRPQTFNPGAGKMSLWDLSVFASLSGSELNLDGQVSVGGCFCNTGTLIVLDGALLEVSAEGSTYSNTGTILATSTGKVIRQKMVPTAVESEDVLFPAIAVEGLAPI